MAAATEISKANFLSHSSPQQSCGVFWVIFIKTVAAALPYELNYINDQLHLVNNVPNYGFFIGLNEF